MAGAKAISLRTLSGEFDLIGNEDIVQTLSIFSLKDITSRNGEYSNEFEMPKTSNNMRLLGYADVSIVINSLPYKKETIEIYTHGFFFKTGFLQVISIKDTIRARFYTGNSNFYNDIKGLNLNNLDWSDRDHFWNLNEAEAAAGYGWFEGYVYPVMSYNGQTLTGDVVDIRKILPATYERQILERIASYLGLTITYDFDVSKFNKALLPYSNKNATISPEIQLLNSVDVGLSNNYFPVINNRINVIPNSAIYKALSSTNNFDGTTVVPEYTAGYNIINTVGSSQNFNFIQQSFTAQYSGMYDLDFQSELVDYNYMTFNFSPAINGYSFRSETILKIFKILQNGTSIELYSESSSVALAAATGGTYNSFDLPIQTPGVTSINHNNVPLNAGESLIFRIYYAYNGVYSVPTTSGTTTSTVVFNPQVKDSSTLTVNLQPELVFGGLITYSSMLPKIKCSDFLKDLSIRFGFIINVYEDQKVLYLSKFENIRPQWPNIQNWSRRIDDTEPEEITFSYDNYAQNNYFKHKPDKSILSTPEGTDYNLTVPNANLDYEKDFYTSPFAASENILFNGNLTCYINLYDVNTNKFDKDVENRICFSDVYFNSYKFTDGTTTTPYLDCVLCWFIDDSKPELSMGFGTDLINQNSSALISALQDVRIIKQNVKLNIIDIKIIDYLKPVWIEQYQSYFFISSINQFNYTNPQTTEVELIKLNL